MMVCCCLSCGCGECKMILYLLFSEGAHDEAMQQDGTYPDPGNGHEGITVVSMEQKMASVHSIVSTMAIHDSATGTVKRHIIRKVCLSFK